MTSDSSLSLDPMKKHPLHHSSIRWWVCTVLKVFDGEGNLKCKLTIHRSMNTSFNQRQKPLTRQPSYMLYRNLMLKLLAKPKPAFEQLCFELPCLMGFRAHEVCTWRAEWINFNEGECYVLDSKKHELILVALSYHVAIHTEQELHGRKEGLVLQNRSNAWKNKCIDKPLSIQALWHVWDKHVKPLDLPKSIEISPIVGRRYYIAESIRGHDRSEQVVSIVSKQVRHANSQQTRDYNDRLYFIEDVKKQQREFDEHYAMLQNEFVRMNEKMEKVKT